jgi:Heterokaryon incompatibility protein (HET)
MTDNNVLNVCNRCRDLKPKIQETAAWYIKQLLWYQKRTTSTVKVFIRSGVECVLCDIFHEVDDKAEAGLLPTGQLVTRTADAPENCNTYEEGSSVSLIVGSHDKLLKPTSQQQDKLWNRDGEGLWLLPLAQDSEDESRYFARTLKDQVDFGVVQSWLDTCVEHHDVCREEGSKVLPFQLRVMDCVDRKITYLPPRAAYLTLSYVWGASNQHTPFTWELECPLLPDSLPPLIEDAINATIALGRRYLWVRLTSTGIFV